MGRISKKHFLLWHWRLLVVVIVLSGLFIGAARLFLPIVTDYRADIETLAAEILEQPVTIESIDSGWSWLHPVVIFRGVQVQQTNNRGVVNLDSLKVELAIIPSLLSGELRPSSIIVHMQEFELSRTADGRFNFNLGDLAESGDARFDKRQLDWVLHQPDLHLDIERFSFTDGTGKLPDILLHDVDLDFDNQSDKLVGKLSAGASKIAEKITLMLSLNTQNLTLENFHADVYLELQRASLSFWKQVLAGEVGMPDTGETDLALWGAIRDGKLVRVSGDLAMGNLSYSLPEQGVFSVESMGGKYNWQLTDKGWSLQIAQLQIQRLGRKWPASTLSVEYESGENSRYTVNADYLKVQDFMPLVDRQPIVQALLGEDLGAVSPSGEIAGFKIRLSMNSQKQLVSYALQAGLTNFSVNAHAEWPGMTGIDGYLVATEQAGMVKLDTTDALLDLKTVFRDPLRIDTLQGNINWTWLDSGLLLESSQLDADNSHISTQSRLSIHVPEEGSVFLDVQTNFKDGDGAYTSFYLPANALDEEALAWLDKGIVSGNVEYGSFILYGAADNFPFDNKDGHFEVRFKVNNGILDYYEDWPVIDEIEAEVAFIGRSMHINANSGKIFGADIMDTQVAIQDLENDNPILIIDGNARTPSSDLFRYLKETGLIGEYQAALSALKLGGENKLELALTLPLSKGETSVKGRVDFLGNRLDIADWGLRLDDIRGALRFKDQSFVADDLVAVFDRQPMQISIDTGQAADGPVTHIVARSSADLSRLIAPKNKILASQFTGRSPFEVSIDIPDIRPSELKIHSSLVGTELKFPHPLSKSSEEQLDFTLQTGFSGESEEDIVMSLGNRLQASFDVDTKTHELESAYVQFGAGEAKHRRSDKQALVLGGRLDYLDLDAWKSWYQGLGVSTSDTDLSFAFNTDLTIDRMKYARWFIDNVHVSTSSNDRYWQVDLSGKGAEGKATYDYDKSELALDLKHLVIFKRPYVAPEGGADEGMFNRLRPADIPAADINIQELMYAERDIGQLSLKAYPETTGYRLSEAVMKTDETTMRVNGNWIGKSAELKGKDKTEITADIQSSDFGSFMKRLGYADTVKNGKSSMQAKLSLDSSPMNFDVSRLSGDIELSLLKGEVVELDPGGAGRVFGLLSFQTLPRRLSLDFRDIFSKGMSFDEIVGSFTISKGQAYTNNLTMVAPSSQVEVSGRIGLADQDYDQHVRVIPNLSSTLPIAGALAGGPGLAVVMLITHQLLQKPIDKLTEFEYRVTGPWKSPEVVKVDKNKEKVAREEGQPIESTDSDDSL
jgi:uncharacterized protein (TIGR02099 family)